MACMFQPSLHSTRCGSPLRPEATAWKGPGDPRPGPRLWRPHSSLDTIGVAVILWPQSDRVMRNLFIGIDSGTQSTKVLVVDGRNGSVLATATQAYELIPDLPPGAKEQHPHTWREAASAALRQALRGARANPTEVRAIGVSGQQHGFVPLDKDGQDIRPAKLWCDTTTTAECEEITERLGGAKKTMRALGNAVLPRSQPAACLTA